MAAFTKLCNKNYQISLYVWRCIVQPRTSPLIYVQSTCFVIHQFCYPPVLLSTSFVIHWLSTCYPLAIHWLSTSYPLATHWLSTGYPLAIYWLFTSQREEETTASSLPHVERALLLVVISPVVGILDCYHAFVQPIILSSQRVLASATIASMAPLCKNWTYVAFSPPILLAKLVYNGFRHCKH